MASRLIVGGPAKWDLMVSLFEGSNSARTRRSVTFQTSGSRPGSIEVLEVATNSLEREDGSGENWNFKGWRIRTQKEVSGFFSTKSRTGWFVEAE